jgi:phage gpG-like protein
MGGTMMRFRLAKKSENLLQTLATKAAEGVGKCGAFLALKVIESSMRAFDVANKGEPMTGYRIKWKPWADSTKEGYERAGLAKRRAKRKGKKAKGKKAITHSLLYASGALSKGITAGYKIESKTRARVWAGVTGAVADYGKAHQYGTDKAGRNRNVRIPARPFIGITPEAISEVNAYIGANLKSSMGAK